MGLTLNEKWIKVFDDLQVRCSRQDVLYATLPHIVQKMLQIYGAYNCVDKLDYPYIQLYPNTARLGSHAWKATFSWLRSHNITGFYLDACASGAIIFDIMVAGGKLDKAQSVSPKGTQLYVFHVTF